MKKNLFFIGLLFPLFLATAQIGIGTINPDPSTILDIYAADKGILIPRVSLSNITDTMLDGLNTAATGLLIYNTNALVTGGNGVGYYYYNGTSWDQLSTAASVTDDIDWYEEGTTSSPNAITDDIYTQGNVAIGKTTANYRLDISETTGSRGINTSITGSNGGSIYGTYVSNSNTGSGAHLGSYKRLAGLGTGQQYGSYQTITNTGTGTHYGSYNTLSGSGIGLQYGSYQTVSNTGSATHFGSYNLLSGFGTGLQYGSYQTITNTGIGDHVGSYNTLIGTGTGKQYGSYQTITNTGTGIHYGSYNTLSGSGIGLQYGSYQAVSNSGIGAHFGSYNRLSGSGAGLQYGTYQTITNSGIGVHIGSYNFLGGTGLGVQYGTYQTIGNSGNNPHYGTFNSLSGIGSGLHHGVYNILSGSGIGEQKGVYNSIININNTTHYGVHSELTGTGSGEHKGIHNSLSGSGTGTQYGVYNDISNTGDGTHISSYNYLSGNSIGLQYGTYQNITNTGDNAHYGTYSSLSGVGTGTQFGSSHSISNTGSGIHYGNYNSLTGSGTGFQYGVYNYISNSGDFAHYGVNNYLIGSGLGAHYGFYNLLAGPGEGFQYGIRTQIDNSGNGVHYGSYNLLSGSGTGNKLAFYSYISSTAGGIHYGIYSDVSKVGSYAGYFLGNVSVGTTTSNNYIFPASRGTNSQVIQTDASGNLSWVDTSTIGDDLGNHTATTDLNLNSNIISSVSRLTMLATSDYDKLRVYDTASYAIGMHSAMTYGFLNDQAMTFTMPANSNSGWIFRDISDIQSDGAMSLSTDGKMTIKSYLDITSITDASGTAGTGGLQVGGSLRIDGNEIITTTNNTLYLQNDNNGDLRVDANTLVVDASTNSVGIKTTTPSFDLHIKQSSISQNGTGGLGLTSSADTNYWKVYHSGAHLSFSENGVRRSYITAGTGAYFTVSDKRLKKNIEPMGTVIDKINNLSAYSFLYADQNASSKKTLGFISQDIQLLFPELVETTEDGYLGLNYSGFGVLAIKAIQEQQKEIDQLKQELAEIKAMLKKQ